MSSNPNADRSYRVLWSQVVLQAKEDLEHEPISSLLYDQAVAFFTGRGEWAESRAMIADCLEIHPDALTKSGEHWVAVRRAREGLPPKQPSASPRLASSNQPPAPLPRLEALPGPDRSNRKASRRNVPRAVNPFNPHRAHLTG